MEIKVYLDRHIFFCNYANWFYSSQRTLGRKREARIITKRRRASEARASKEDSSINLPLGSREKGRKEDEKGLKDSASTLPIAKEGNLDLAMKRA